MREATSAEMLDNLLDRLEHLMSVVNPAVLELDISSLESAVAAPDLWDDKEKAQLLNHELARKKLALSTLTSLKVGMEDTKVLLELSDREADLEAAGEVREEIGKLSQQLLAFETEILLNGEYDDRSAVMSIRSGAGGDDATDFAEMLMRMYLRYADLEGLKATVLDVSQSEGAGIKSTSIIFEGPFAFGKLSVESGTHRLVRISPFNSAGKRQTSFAAVEVVPLIEATDAINVPETEIRVDVYRSSGPGGQSVNTTDSAVRITHLPSGIVVSCQNEKSQLQNKLEAMRVLQSRLLELRRMEEQAKTKQLAGDVKASWGEQMRSYVLAPYQMVKDLRTLHEENNPEDVFDGKLEAFISAGIKWRAQQNS